MSNLPIIPDYEGELSTAPARSGTISRQISPLQVLWRGRWIVLLCSALAVGGGFLFLELQTPIYSSSSRVDVEQEIKINQNDPNNDIRTTNYLATQCELIKSQQILGSVAERSELRSMKTFDGVDQPISKLKSLVSATTSKLDDLITVSFESPFPSEAAAIANDIVESYVDYHARKKRTSAAEVLRILTKEKNDRDAELTQKMTEMAKYKQDNPNLSYAGDGKTNIILEYLATLSNALGTARLDTLQAKADCDAAVATMKDPARSEQWMQMQENSPNNQTAADIRRLQIQIDTMAQTVGAASSAVKALELQMKELKASMRQQSQQSLDGYVAVTQQHLETAKQKEADIRNLFEEQQQLALGLNKQNTEYQLMEIETQRLERESDLLDSRIKEVRLVEDTGALNITVLETARPSNIPSKPKWSVVLFEAVAAGLALGGGLAYLRELMDHRLRSVEDIRTTLGLAVLGAVPRMVGKEGMSIRGQKVQIEPMSNIAEAYRTIRTAIYFSAREEKARTIVVTSPAPGDGKSTSASNLAISMAQAGQRVLLMDADLRKPVQHKIFKLDDSTGLTSVVTGKSPLSEAVKTTDIPGLYVLPSGPIPRNPAEILTSAAFVKVLEKLRTKFDHIVIDSPPVAPVTDSGILGGLCDATIIVVRANKSTRRVSLQAVNYLMSVGSKMLGVIANEISSGDGNYGYHGYGYGYYSTRGVLTTKHVKAIEGNGHSHDELSSVGASRE